MSSAHAPTEWVVGPGRGEGGMKRQLERFVRARFSFQMPLQSTFFFGQLPGLNFSISALISITLDTTQRDGQEIKTKGGAGARCGAGKVAADEYGRAAECCKLAVGPPSSCTQGMHVSYGFSSFLHLFSIFLACPPTAIWFRRCGTCVHGKYYYCKNQNKCHNQLHWLALQRQCLKTK